MENTKEKINLSECINQSLQIGFIGIPSISEEKRSKCLQVRLLIIHVSFGSRKSCEMYVHSAYLAYAERCNVLTPNLCDIVMEKSIES